MRIIVYAPKTSPILFRAFTEKLYLCIMNSELTLRQMALLLQKRPHDAHKGTMGHAFLLAGSKGIAGCAILCAEACLRSGAGKLTMFTQEANRIILQTAVPESILLIAEDLITDPCMNGYQSIGIGPGIGTSKTIVTFVEKILSESQKLSIPVVLDADALHLLATHPQWASLLTNRAILTPHPGEMRHLIEGFSLNANKMLHSAQELAQRYKITIVFKGHPTFICFPTGKILSCPRGNSGMATAGSGDVLTGVLTGLLAQGYSISHATSLAVWLHATAGDYASLKLQEECMLARDIIQHMPQAFSEVKQIMETE